MVEHTACGVIVSMILFVGGGFCEIAGGWLVWKWRRDGWHWPSLLFGSLALTTYGLIPPLQEQAFGRTYAAYGGLFIVLAIGWGWVLDGDRPNKWDVIGALIAYGGVALIMFMGSRRGGTTPAQATATVTPAPAPLPGSV